MKGILLALLLFCMLHPVAGQNKTRHEYHTQVVSINGAKQTGILVHLGDSVLQLVPTDQVSKGRLLPDATRYTFAVRDVQQLLIQRKGNVLFGTLLGGGLGLVVGALVGYATYRPCDTTNSGGWFDCIEIFDQTESTVAAGTFGAVVGAGIGSIAGSSRQHIHIGGDQTTYLLAKERLQQFIL